MDSEDEKAWCAVEQQARVDAEAEQACCAAEQEHQACVNDSSDDGSFFSLLTQDSV